MIRHLAFLLLLPVAMAVAACETTKSASPLSPSVAGPIPGVNITAPQPVDPNGARIAVDKQPITLSLENASTSGVRPLNYMFEVATDAAFTNKVFMRENIAPGEGGRTTLRLPDPLASGRTYYWRGRAQDGANTGPYSSAVTFDVYTPIVINQPVLVSPVDNVLLDNIHPRFVIANAPRSGPVGAIAYVIELSDSDSFANKLAIWTVSEQSGQTGLDAPQNLSYTKQYFWHARAYDPTTTGPWSATQVFRTPDPPPPPKAPSPSPGGGGNAGSHVGPGPLSADRAQQVVFATAAEFPGLLAVFNSQDEAESAAEQLLLRTIWHLKLAGFNAARQRNPSGAISKDKLTIYIDGSWHAYDIYSLGVAGRATTVQFFEVGGANPVPDGGIPD